MGVACLKEHVRGMDRPLPEYICTSCDAVCGPEYPEICSLRRWWISRPFWDRSHRSQGRPGMDILYDCDASGSDVLPTQGWLPYWRSPCPYQSRVLTTAASPGPTLRVVTAGHAQPLRR